jgi:hypothetical protein
MLSYRPDIFAEIARRTRWVPHWITQAEGGLTPLSYYYSLAETYPLLLALLPLVFIAAVCRTGRLGVYLTLWFAVPLFLHSFVLAMKGGRFILIPMLGLFAAAAIAAVWCAELIRKAVMERASLWGWPRHQHRLATVVIVLVAVSAFLTLPALHQSRKMIGGNTTRWTAAAEILRARPDLAGIPIGQSRALHALFYWGRLDFILGEPRLDDGESRVVVRAPVLATADEIATHFASAGGVLIGIDADLVEGGLVDQRLANMLARQAVELCQRQCGTLSLYYWHFDTSHPQ